MIYHYTSQDTAHKILTLEKIRLSNIMFLNDGEEFWLAFKLYKKYLEMRSKGNDKIDNHILDDFKRLDNWTGGERMPSIHACCFSREADDAAQWDRYGDKGKGVVLGFSDDVFDKEIDQYCEFGDILYSEADQWKMIDKKMREIESALVEQKYTGDMSTPLIKSWAFFKDASFKSESECRIAKFGVPGMIINFFPRGGQMVPYIDIDLDVSKLGLVRLGPTATNESLYSWSLILHQISRKQGSKLYGKRAGELLDKSKSRLR